MDSTTGSGQLPTMQKRHNGTRRQEMYGSSNHNGQQRQDCHGPRQQQWQWRRNGLRDGEAIMMGDGMVVAQLMAQWAADNCH